jgi:hypothetical protein
VDAGAVSADARLADECAHAIEVLLVVGVEVRGQVGGH